MTAIDDTKRLQDIEAAFSDGVYPGDDNVVYDNSDTYCDVAELKADCHGKHWKELSGTGGKHDG